MSRHPVAWRWLKVSAGAVILAALAWRLGAAPFLDGITRIDARAVLAALVLTFFTTVCSAWRWRLVGRSLGLELSLRRSIVAYYRSQFLNTALPGGVLGDVHRGLAHGRDQGEVRRGLAAVAGERLAGQLVQLVLAVLLLALLPSPLRLSLPLVAAAVAALAVGALLVLRVRSAAGPALRFRAVRSSVAGLRAALLAGRAWPGVVLASVGATAGHAAVFLIAARTAGVAATPVQLLPLAMLVLLAMAVPANIAGWGPREGAAAWAFGAVGLGAGQGVSVAVVYGVLAIIACLPGAAAFIPARGRPGRRRAGLADSPQLPRAATVGAGGTRG